MPKVDDPIKSTEKNTGEEKKNKSSIIQILKDTFMGEHIGKSEDMKESIDTDVKPENKKESTDTDGKSNEKTAVKGKSSTSHTKKKAEKKVHEEQKEDPALNIIEEIKSHKVVQWLRKRKEKVIKAVAITISVILFVIAIIYSLTPTEQVASNVIFGERAMFSVLLIMVAVLILAAVFANRLLEGKYFKDIHKDLEIVEGKREKDNHKGKDDQKSHHDPIIERMNKKE